MRVPFAFEGIERYEFTIVTYITITPTIIIRECVGTNVQYEYYVIGTHVLYRVYYIII